MSTTITTCAPHGISQGDYVSVNGKSMLVVYATATVLTVASPVWWRRFWYWITGWFKISNWIPRSGAAFGANVKRYRFRKFLLIVIGLLKGLSLREMRQAIAEYEKRRSGNSSEGAS